MIRPVETTADPLQPADASRELVVLTHGIASSRFFMSPLARRLRRVGFQTRLYGYPSLWWSNRSFGEKLAAMLRRVGPRYDRIHLVVHSMGAIVTRCALEEDLPANLGRVVQIAPPNRGSHAATLYGHWNSSKLWNSSRLWNALVVAPHRWLAPSLLELCDTPDSFVNQLGPVPEGVEVGVLAASKDRVLHPEQTHVEGQRDHRTVTGWHTGVLWTRETAEMTKRFLLSGSFADPATAPTA